MGWAGLDQRHAALLALGGLSHTAARWPAARCLPPLPAHPLKPPSCRCPPAPQVNMLAREYCDGCKPKRLKPVVLSHPMLPGLLEVGARRGSGAVDRLRGGDCCCCPA